MLYMNMKLTFLQMYHMGLHMGHTFLTSKFLSYWIYGGWRSNIFIMNLMKTSIMLSMMMDSIYASIIYFKPIWFINLDSVNGPLITSYAILCGEPYVTYYWMNGTLTNFFSIFSWFNMLYKLAQTYEMSHSDKHKLLGYFGFLMHSLAFPGMGFITSTLISWSAVNEFWKMKTSCAAVVDSNIVSWNVSVPIPGNDDSIMCQNYYCYIVTYHVMYSKVWGISLFKEVIQAEDSPFGDAIKIKKKMLLIYFYSSDQKMLNVKKSLMKNIEMFPNDFMGDYSMKIDWKMPYLKFHLSIFNTMFTRFTNEDFFEFMNKKSEVLLNFQENNLKMFDPYEIY